MEKNVYIIGEIGVDYTLNDALLDFQRTKDADIINIMINSPGGYLEEGLEIRDLFANSGKIIKTSNIGDVASVAVNLFLIAKRENRFYNAEKGSILIHYPWAEGAGNSEQFSEMAEQLKKQENELVKDLANKLNVNENVLRGYMQQERFLTLEEIKSLDIANIIQEKFKAVAKIKNETMNNEEVTKELTAFRKMLDEIKGMFKPKALILQDANGAEINIPEIQDIEELKKDLSVTVDGEAGTGDYVLNDGRTLVIDSGKIVEIKEAEPDELEALKSENEDLKKQIAEIKNEDVNKTKEIENLKVEMQAKLKKVSEDFSLFKNKFSKENVKTEFKTPKEKTEKRTAFK